MTPAHIAALALFSIVGLLAGLAIIGTCVAAWIAPPSGWEHDA